MQPVLTINDLILEAGDFCRLMSQVNHAPLLGVTDGKAVGTYVEHKFQNYLIERYVVEIGNSAKGIDLPGQAIQTDIKVTSYTQPQSSCPFRSAQQKIFGLGYNLLVFVYDKQDSADQCHLRFTNCAFVDKARTADYITTVHLRKMVLEEGANKEDIMAFLVDRNIPGDEIILGELADKILASPPEQGYLTISNALQWRLQYSRAIGLNNTVPGVINIQ